MKNAIHRVTKHNYIIDTCLVSCFKVLEDSLSSFQNVDRPRPSWSLSASFSVVLGRPCPLLND